MDVDTLDLTDRAAVLATLRRWHARAVVHCAAYTQVDQAETDAARCRAVNATAVASLAEASRELDSPLVQDPRRLSLRRQPWNRQTVAGRGPARPAGRLRGDEVGRRAGGGCLAEHLIVRTCGLYARPSHTTARHFVKTILRLARTQPKLRVVDDQRCTPSYVPHVARAIVYLLGTNGAVSPARGGSTTT